MSKFNVIVADPPWAFNDMLQKMKKPTKRSAVSQYQVMSAADVAKIDVPSIVDPAGCLLALWVPSTLLPAGLEVMQAWGFTFKTTVCWVKRSALGKLGFGMGHLFRASHEIALIGTVGSVVKTVQDHSQRSVFLAPNAGHSTKPDCLHKSLELMFPNANRLEMFARRTQPGWTCIGDGVTGVDINVSIQQLTLV